MNQSVDLNKLKAQAKVLQQRWRKKLSYLSDSISRSGMEGAAHWLKTHNQIEQLKEALEDLLKTSNDPEFRLSQVDTTLNSFTLPEEDQQQAEWYKTADLLLTSFQAKLINDKLFDKTLLAKALNELKFISEANEFHERYQIDSIQQQVIQVYQELLKELAEFKQFEKEKLAQQQEQEKLQLAQLAKDKAEAEAKKVMLESVKIKEKRIAIIEEKKRKIAEKELLESQAQIDYQQSEIKAKQAEEERQAKLQDAYVDLQLEEKINQWSLGDVVNVLKEKLDQDNFDSSLRLKVEQLIEELGQPSSE
ncbi:hypothetical protein [Aliikangiella maris]|uniref:Uncharacterized protein n=2 Tax=Aliikangiella maris TaxID=3162458 RepID=A0ABV3MUF2_9GAMM